MGRKLSAGIAPAIVPNPRLPAAATRLLAATSLPDAESILGDLWEEFHGHAVPKRGIMRAQIWFVLQVIRSLAPLFFRSWRRASVARASAAMIALAAAATIPATALLSLRAFVLSQVPLKTTPELSAAFALLLFVVLGVSAVVGFAISARLLNWRGPR